MQQSSARRDGSVVAAETNIRLFLSGGSNRATLGAVGAIAALVDLDKWRQVNEVVSVSGGSFANAALLTGPSAPTPAGAGAGAGAGAATHLPAGPAGGSAHDSIDSRPVDWADDPMPALSALVQRMLGDRFGVFATPRRRLLVACLAAQIVAVIVVGARLAGAGPGSGNAALALLFGVLAVPAVISGGRRIASAWWADVVGRVTAAAGAALADKAQQRQHLFCAAGLSSGVPYTFWAGEKAPDAPWGELLRAGYTVADAVVASTSLPGIGRTRAPRSLRSELLVDGGVSGIFGQQTDDHLHRKAGDTYRGDTVRIAIDGGRHSMSDPAILARFSSFSMVYALIRWLRVSLEATYVNDLGDWRGGHLIRLCHDPSLRPATGPHGAGLDHLRRQVGSMGIFGLTPTSAADAITCGYVATRSKLDPGIDQSRLMDALVALGTTLDMGHELASRWAAAASTHSKESA